IDVKYLGNISELPVLSTNPLSYFTATDIKFYDSQTGKLLSSDPITSFRSVSVPESDSVLGLLAIGVGGAALLLKRKYSVTHLG
ncbi:MAG: PEP-CTERM sorting domain-containing protein, partial [Nostoc sp.]